MVLRGCLLSCSNGMNAGGYWIILMNVNNACRVVGKPAVLTELGMKANVAGCSDWCIGLSWANDASEN